MAQAAEAEMHFAAELWSPFGRWPLPRRWPGGQVDRPRRRCAPHLCRG